MSATPIQPAPPTYAGDESEKHEYMHVGLEQPQQNSVPLQSYPQETYQQNIPQH